MGGHKHKVKASDVRDGDTLVTSAGDVRVARQERTRTGAVRLVLGNGDRMLVRPGRRLWVRAQGAAA